jgi:hypothetical protein
MTLNKIKQQSSIQAANSSITMNSTQNQVGASRALPHWKVPARSKSLRGNMMPSAPLPPIPETCPTKYMPLAPLSIITMDHHVYEELALYTPELQPCHEFDASEHFQEEDYSTSFPQSAPPATGAPWGEVMGPEPPTRGRSNSLTRLNVLLECLEAMQLESVACDLSVPDSQEMSGELDSFLDVYGDAYVAMPGASPVEVIPQSRTLFQIVQALKGRSGTHSGNRWRLW